MNNIRFTRGVTESGVQFEFHDDWTVPASAHKLLDEPWIGSTVFFERGKSELNDMNYGVDVQVEQVKSKMKWSDVFD